MGVKSTVGLTRKEAEQLYWSYFHFKLDMSDTDLEQELERLNDKRYGGEGFENYRIKEDRPVRLGAEGTAMLIPIWTALVPNATGVRRYGYWHPFRNQNEGLATEIFCLYIFCRVIWATGTRHGSSAGNSPSQRALSFAKNQDRAPAASH